MHFGVITLFPELVTSVTQSGITGRAEQQGIIRLDCWNPRDFTQDKHRTVDDRPYGGGPGMVLMAPPVMAAIDAAKQTMGRDTPVIALSPQGKRLDQQSVNKLAERGRAIMLAGRYEGIDERVMSLGVDEEYSLGDYVLSGGELGAMVIIDAVTRQLPGALGHALSANEDSFADGLLDCPHYTRPEVYEGIEIPAVLSSGNHEQIRRWRLKQSLGRTWQRRPDLLEGRELTAEQQALLAEFKEDSK